MDVREAVKLKKWDIGIFHPVCRKLCNSGVLRLYINGKKENGVDFDSWEDMIEGANFFKECLDFDIPYIRVENPIPHSHALKIIGVKYDQIVQPYNFGEDASKKTCFWLKGLPKIKNTSYFPPRYVNGKKRWSNQCDSGQSNMGKGCSKKRSKTYSGIAQAIAETDLKFWYLRDIW